MTTLKATSSRLSPDAAQVVRTMHYTAQRSMTPENITTPSFWGPTLNLAGAQPGDYLIIQQEDLAWVCTCLVTAVDDHGAQLAVVGGTVTQNPMPKGLAPRSDDGFIVRHLGSHHGWAAIRPDGTTLGDGFPAEQAAYGWLAQYRATLRKDKQREAAA